MMLCKTKKDQEVSVEVHPSKTVLKELFGAAKGKLKKSTKQILEQTRREMKVD